MSPRVWSAILVAGIVAAIGCGRSSAVPAAPKLAGSWSRGNDRLTVILAFHDDGDELRFRWTRLASDGKRRTDCDWDGVCVEKIQEKAVGEYRCVLEPGGTPETASVSCSGWLDEGRRTELTWTDEFVVDPDGSTLRCYSRELNGQTFEGNARPLRVFTKVGDGVAYPPKRARS
jgi:hypothetical protein